MYIQDPERNEYLRDGLPNYDTDLQGKKAKEEPESLILKIYVYRSVQYRDCKEQKILLVKTKEGQTKQVLFV